MRTNGFWLFAGAAGDFSFLFSSKQEEKLNRCDL
jgi:hypothetical protein